MPYYIPQTIVDKEPFDHNKHCTIPFGEFLQAKNDNNPKNSDVSQSIDSIYLRWLDNIQSGDKIFYIHSRRVIKRSNIIKTPIPKAIFKYI